MTAFSIAELICTCIARQIEDGEIVAQGIATPLVAAGYILAKLTHAPNVIFASAIGNALNASWAPLSLARIEELWLGRALAYLTFTQIACELLPTFQPKEFLRPAQVDPYGHLNNIVIGDYRAPQMRLPGCGGIADVTTFSSRLYLYVPRHNRAVFVEKLDFRSGLGHLSSAERERLGLRAPGPRYLVSNLGQFDFANGRMRLITHHPGVTVESIQKKTGFALEIAPNVHETTPPSGEEVRLLREEIDPLGIRELEILSGPRRRAKLREIIAREGQQSSQPED